MKNGKGKDIMKRKKRKPDPMIEYPESSVPIAEMIEKTNERLLIKEIASHRKMAKFAREVHAQWEAQQDAEFARAYMGIKSFMGFFVAIVGFYLLYIVTHF